MSWAKPGNIGKKVYSTSKNGFPEGYPFLVSEDELATLVHENYVADFFYNRMYCTVDEYVLCTGITEEMIVKRIGRELVYSTQTYVESQDGQ